MLKKYLLLLLASAPTTFILAQSVGIGTATPHSSSKLQISASDRGVLIPNVALTSTTISSPVASPATSLLVYNTAISGITPNNVTPGYYYWDGTKWVRFQDSPTDDWHTTGNTGTSATTNFIGTIDNIDFVTRTNNLERLRVVNDGRVRIGGGSPFQYGLSKLEVQGDATAPHISYSSTYPSILLMRHNGTTATPTTLANGDNVGELRWYAHNGTTYMQTARILSYIDGAVSAGSVPGDLRFMTNTLGNNLTDEKMRITNSGRLGIGTLTSAIGSTYGFEKIKMAGDANINDVELEAVGPGGFGPFIVFGKSNGTYSTGTRTIVNNGDQIGNFQYNAYDGTAYRPAAHIIVIVDGVPGANDIPTRMDFYTSADGTAAATTRMSITNAGLVGIGTSAPDASALLQVSATNRGVLIPNVALTATNTAGPITSPATSLLVYNTATASSGATAVTPGYY